jgi:hypothetical protein
MVEAEQSEEPTPEEAAEKERRAKRDVIKLKKMIRNEACQQMWSITCSGRVLTKSHNHLAPKQRTLLRLKA